MIDIRDIYKNNFIGILLFPHYQDLYENGEAFYAEMSFIISGTNLNQWYENYAPSLIVKGEFNNQIIITKPIFHGGTLVYNYDDIAKVVDLYSYRNNVSNDYSKTKYLFDFYGNIKEKKILKGGTEQVPIYDSYFSYFNFLNKQSKEKDGAGNEIKFSYDGLERLIQTDNADGSYTTTTYSYQSSIGNYYFGTVPGTFFEKQIFVDESENVFEKYFDALGNLRREVKFLLGEGGGEAPPIELITDYLYDTLNRLTKVKTPEEKIIEYEYDGYGRQSQMETVDSGIKKFKYDSNNNLVYSQDSNQSAIAAYIYTFKQYDALNRLIVEGENSRDRGDFDEMDPDDNFNFTVLDNPDPYLDYLVVNVFDDFSTASANIFTPPSDYTPNSQNYNYFLKGRLAATAYRTRRLDLWNFKYYRYDERGRIKTLWHVIYGLTTRKIEYYYNSQDQVTSFEIINSSSDYKRFKYYYDKPGRLNSMFLYVGNPSLDDPLAYINLLNYEYNSNGLVSHLGMLDENIRNNYSYNQRNWIDNCSSVEGILNYNMQYFPNGNVQTLDFNGSYSSNFVTANDLFLEYIYDKSNRLISSDCTNFSGNGFDVDNTYDKDGNIMTLKRYKSDGTLKDNFVYTYYPGTNRLKSVSSQFQDFLYDNNGNLTKDDLNKNFDMIYDFRNLITFIRHLFYGMEGEVYTQVIFYFYDETGNRVRKLIFQSYVIDPEIPVPSDNLENYPIYKEEDFYSEAEQYFSEDGLENPTLWFLVKNEYYLRGIGGNELAIYEGNNIKKYNIWGRENEGSVDPDNSRNYFLKDHLGSIRVIVGESKVIISAEDYDMWGYAMEGRSFDSYKSRYKFTGKERDSESNLDYFGARYYYSRIGKWNSVDPLMEKHFDYSTYNYVLNNSLKLIDPDGKQDDVARKKIEEELRPMREKAERLHAKFKEAVQLGREETSEKLTELAVKWTAKQVIIKGLAWVVGTRVGLALAPAVGVVSPAVVGVLIGAAAIILVEPPDANKDVDIKLKQMREEDKEHLK